MEGNSGEVKDVAMWRQLLRRIRFFLHCFVEFRPHKRNSDSMNE